MHLQVPDFQSAKVLVIGDIMLDRYWYGETKRISPEAPVPIVSMHHGKIHHSLGGAANVATNLTALGVKTTLLGLAGNDEPAQQLIQMLDDKGIAHHLKLLNTHPTITKLRILCQHQQLMRLDFEESFDADDVESLMPIYQQLLPDTDVVILSDYGKGTLTHPEQLIAAAKAKNIRLIVDPKRQDFNAYRGAYLITPNQKEFEAVVGPCKSENIMIEKGHALMEKEQLGALLITRGEHGMLLLQRDKAPFSLPAQTREVYDVTGAGDTVVSILAGSLAINMPLEEAVTLANIGASIVITKLGTASVTPHELEQALPKMTGRHPIYTEAQVIEQCQAARHRGERIVMTNGCFDVLHAGHVVYLNRAKQLGDRLIVAINSDASVKKLKGEHRPINPLEARMQVLASLSAVDWVISFDDDTPERLLELIRPDILVKGGDYDVEGVVGAEIVKKYGGEVAVLDSGINISTTKILEQGRK